MAENLLASLTNPSPEDIQEALRLTGGDPALVGVPPVLPGVHPGIADLAIPIPQAARVPAQDVKLLNETKPSTRFPQVDWQKVRYATKIPALDRALAALGKRLEISVLDTPAPTVEPARKRA